MKIDSIRIENFRQFWHPVTIEFSKSNAKNVTVIHGANGSGKTSLLNAFKWCFYGETDFDTNTDNILNEAAIQNAVDGSTVELSINVKFSVEEKHYDVKRIAKFKKLSGMNIEQLKGDLFVVDVISDNGESQRIKTPQAELNKVLPHNLQPYFFFNGERIEKLAGANESGQIKEAIKYLMGLELVDRGERHLKKAADQFRKLNKENNSEAYASLTSQAEEIQADLESLSEKEIERKATLKNKERLYQECNDKLKKYDHSKALQEQREILSESIAELEKEIADVVQQQKNLIDDNRALVFSMGMFKTTEKLVDDNRKKGVLPYRVRDQFIQDLIEQASCICGRPIEKNSLEERELYQVKESAGNDNLEDVFTRVSALLNNYKGDYEKYKQSSKELSNKLKELQERLDRKSEEMTEINSKILTGADKEVAKLEHTREKLENEIEVLKHDVWGIESDSKDFKSDLDRLQKEIKKLEEKQEGQSILLNQIKIAENVSNAFAELNEVLTDKVRVELSEKVNTTFQGIIRKPVSAGINEDYTLKVQKMTLSGDEFETKEQSTGEKQVTSLSFIASIIALAKEQYSNQKAQFFTGGLYPLVMDSPFGQLDDDYRLKVAQSVSTLADQVIIFVSNSQWKGSVKEACEAKTGKSYKLIYHSPSDSHKNAKEGDYVQFAEEGCEYSTIQEVTNG